MLIFEKNLGPDAPEGGRADYSVELTAHERSSFRLHFILGNGLEAGIILPRGTRLPQPNDVLQSADGTMLLIKAKPEEVVQARAPDVMTFARACYHLGNRHLPLQIAADLTLYFEKDPVIEDLCGKLGLTLTVLMHPFEPEGGAYGGHHHHHGEEEAPAAPELQSYHQRHRHVPPTPAHHAEQD